MSPGILVCKAQDAVDVWLEAVSGWLNRGTTYMVETLEDLDLFHDLWDLCDLDGLAGHLALPDRIKAEMYGRKMAAAEGVGGDDIVAKGL